MPPRAKRRRPTFLLGALLVLGVLVALSYGAKQRPPAATQVGPSALGGLWKQVEELLVCVGRETQTRLEEGKDRIEGTIKECSRSVQAVADQMSQVDIVVEVDRCLDGLAVSVDQNMQQIRSAWCGGQTAVSQGLRKFGEEAQGRFHSVLAEVRNPLERSHQMLLGTRGTLMDRLRTFGKASYAVHHQPSRCRSAQQKIQGLNDRALQSVLKFVQESDGWEHVTTTDGVTVYRKYLDLQGMSGVVIDGETIAEDKSGDSQSSRFACVKAVGVVDAPVEKVFELFLDNTRVHEYNEHCREIADIDKLSDNTKVTWSRSSNYGPFKARDFCTIVHYRRLADGSLVVVNRAAEHVKAPRSDKYVRSQILLAGNVMKPHPKDPSKTLLVTLTHINPGGSVDSKAGAMMMNMLTANSPVSFIRRVELAARRSMEPSCQDPSLADSSETDHLNGFFHATVV